MRGEKYDPSLKPKKKKRKDKEKLKKIQEKYVFNFTIDKCVKLQENFCTQKKVP